MLTSIWRPFRKVYLSTFEPSGMVPNKVFSEVRRAAVGSLVDMLLLIAFGTRWKQGGSRGSVRGEGFASLNRARARFCLSLVRRDALLSAPESAHQQWGGSPHRTEHWLSVAEGNCVAERRGGEQPEANDQSIINKMMNSIRPDALASLLSEGEAQNGNRPEREER